MRDAYITLGRALCAIVAIIAFGILMATLGARREFNGGQGFLVVSIVAGIIGAMAPWVRR